MIVLLPLAQVGWDSWGDAGLLGVCVSAGATGTGPRECSWTGGGDAGCGGEGGRPDGCVCCTGSTGGLGAKSKKEMRVTTIEYAHVMFS